MKAQALIVAAALAVGGMGIIGCEGEVETQNGGTGARVEADAPAGGANNQTGDNARTAAGREGDTTGPITDTINRIDNAAGESANSPGHAGEGIDQKHLEDVNRQGLNPENQNNQKQGGQQQQQNQQKQNGQQPNQNNNGAMNNGTGGDNTDAARTASDRNGPITNTINKIDNAAGADANAPGHAGQ